MEILLIIVALWLINDAMNGYKAARHAQKAVYNRDLSFIDYMVMNHPISLRILLAKDEKDFPWNEDLIQAAEAMCREFLTSKGFAVPAAEQPDGKQEKDGGNDDEREKT